MISRALRHHRFTARLLAHGRSLAPTGPRRPDPDRRAPSRDALTTREAPRPSVGRPPGAGSRAFLPIAHRLGERLRPTRQKSTPYLCRAPHNAPAACSFALEVRRGKVEEEVVERRRAARLRNFEISGSLRWWRRPATVSGAVVGRLVVRYSVRMTLPALNLNDDIQPVSDFRANTAGTLKRLRETGRPLVLTQNGRSAAVLLDVSTYQALVDENELLRDLQAGLVDGREGRVTPHAEARAQLLARYRR